MKSLSGSRLKTSSVRERNLERELARVIELAKLYGEDYGLYTLIDKAWEILAAARKEGEQRAKRRGEEGDDSGACGSP